MAVTAGCPRRPSTWHRSFWWGPRWWDGPSCGRCARSLQVGAGMLLHELCVPMLPCWALLHIPTLPWAPQCSPSLGCACRGHCQVVTGLHPGPGVLLTGFQRSLHPRGQCGIIPGMWQPRPCLACSKWCLPGPCHLPGTGTASIWPQGWLDGDRGRTPVSEHLKAHRLCCLRAGVVGAVWETQALVSPASQAAANARGRAERPQSAAASRIIGISLQEAQQILNVSSLNPEEIQKVEASLEPGRDGADKTWPLQGCCCA